MPRPIHFDITADDPDRAAAFYSSAFGWTFTRWEGPMDYWLVSTGDREQPGIDGGLGLRQEEGPDVPLTLDVPSVDDSVARVIAAGGSIVRPKMAVPGVGWMAVFADPDGNTFGMMEADETAGIE
jgi:predicted enzyme related to lactoylglutathione lyase